MMNSWNFMPNVPVMAQQYSEAKASYDKKNAGKSYDKDIFDIAYRIINSDKLAYLQLGVYWWTVKSALKANGYHIEGDVESPALNIAYKCNTDQVSVYSAFMFRDWFIENCFIENREHLLDNDTGEMYYLIDESHEGSF